MPVDPLSSVLSALRVRCMISAGFSAGAPWGLRFPARNVLKLDAVVRGRCWFIVPHAGEPVLVEEGDVIVFDGRQPFTLASDPAVEPVDAHPVFATAEQRFVDLGGDDVSIVGCHVALGSDGDELLLDALPARLHVHAGNDAAPSLRWLLEQLLQEVSAPRIGSATASAQLAQLLFIHVLRAQLADARSSFPAGLLRALGDEQLRQALQLMHQDPGYPWKLEELARAAAMSRTTFAERFKSASGVPPLTYLHDWRMSLARRRLRDEDAPIAQIAEAVGYSSDNAFSNAFKRAVGVAPSRYRRAARSPAELPAANY
jgi:AraC-like DNA-binding protein